MKTHFKYYWDNFNGDGKAVPFYGLPLAGDKVTDVSNETLTEKGLPIPNTPTYDEWRWKILKKRHCPFCYAVTRTIHDFVRHVDLNHRRKILQEKWEKV